MSINNGDRVMNITHLLRAVVSKISNAPEGSRIVLMYEYKIVQSYKAQAEAGDKYPGNT